MTLQWNHSGKATYFTPEKWPSKRGGLSSGVEINTFMLRSTLSSGLFRGVASCQGGLSKGLVGCVLLPINNKVIQRPLSKGVPLYVMCKNYKNIMINNQGNI